MTRTRIKVVSAAAAGGGTGSLANPYTLAEMFALINAAPAGAFGGTGFMLRDGVYPRSSDGTISNGGNSAADLVIFAENPRKAIIRAAIGGPTTRFVPIKLTTASNASYLTFDGLWIDGQFALGGTSNLAIQTTAGANLHHLSVKNCRFTGMQGNAAEFASCDYVTFVGNTGWQLGKRQPGSDVPNSAASGVTINAKSAPFVFNAYPGFHNIIAYNAFAGIVGPLTDGNGIILDNGGTATAYTIGNTLVIRNLVYGCGARGIHNLRCLAAQGHWIVNNLSFRNMLDKSLVANSSGFGSEIDVQLGGRTHLANNIVVPWAAAVGNYGSTGFRDNDGGGASDYKLYSNLMVAGGRSSGAMVTTGGGQITTITDPGFVAAPSYNPDTIGDPYLVPDPATIGTAFQLAASSALKDSGIDPRAIAAMTPEMVSDILPYLTRDFRGWAAPF